MDTTGNKGLNDKPKGRIKAHEENKRLAAHETGLISEHYEDNDAAAAAAGFAAAAGAGAASAATAEKEAVPKADVPAPKSGIGIARVLGVMCLAALIGLVAIFVYKGVIDDNPDRGQYVAQRFDGKRGLRGSDAARMTKAVPGIPPVAAQALASQRPVIVYLFNHDSQGVDNQGVLNQLAKSVSGTNDIVLIDAYTDQSGSDAYNQALSQRRAQAIANYMVSHGVPASHIKAVGHGETNKYATPELCRRAEISVK